MTTSPPTLRPRPLAFRLLVVFVGAVAIWALMRWLNETLLTDGLTIPVRLANAALVCGLSIPLIVLARRHLDRRPWAGLGLDPLRQAGRPFLVGVAAFLVPSAVGLTAALLTGWVDLQPQVPWATILGWAALLVMLVFFFEALPEELIFRGYLQRNLSTVTAPWVAALGQAVLFTAFGAGLWVASEGWGVLAERGVMFFAVAVVLGLLRVQTGSLWTPIGFHLAFQVVAQSLLGERMSTSNEGGLMLTAIISAFVLATTVTAFLLPREVNWSRPEPERTSGHDLDRSLR
ncbi:CPBP family intramembrane glutamic endopeptidase [Isoptericola croceus]|uniref:CPBP family intramembrane glutamic endopeptidase n=1 Tax=Isoptericola croceus TaxID=3031406 RepID=UPI0023F7C575|nr:type II CAAX endopeptidase family protein [Isoptericola croceus]